MAGIQFTQAPPLDPTAKTGLGIGLQINALDASRTLDGKWTAEALRSLQGWAHSIEAQLTIEQDNRFPEILVLGDDGRLIGWIGARGGYNGGYFSQLYVGGDDPSSAPFFTDVNGNLTIGQNGSVTIRDASAGRVGFIGVETEATKAIISISNATPPVANVTAHGYATGDSVAIAGNSVTAYNANWPITVINANSFSLVGGTASGSGIGGTAARYYAGTWEQAIAGGGTGFADAPFRVFADGSVRVGSPTGGRLVVDAAGNASIVNAGIDLVSGANSITLDPTTLTLTVKGAVGQATLFQGLFELTRIDGINPLQKVAMDNKQILIYNPLGVNTVFISSTLGIDSVNGYKVNGTQVVTSQQPAVTPPSGGTVIDVQARAAISTLISRSQTHGLIL